MWIDAWSSVPISHGVPFSWGRLLLLALPQPFPGELLSPILHHSALPSLWKSRNGEWIGKTILDGMERRKIEGTKQKCQTARHMRTNKNRSHRLLPQVIGDSLPLPYAFLVTCVHTWALWAQGHEELPSWEQSLCTGVNHGDHPAKLAQHIHSKNNFGNFAGFLAEYVLVPGHGLILTSSK